MKLTLMQPYFFPYLGYFDLVNCAGTFVVFDLAQFTRRSWMSRNRVAHPNSGWQYIGVPLKRAPQKTSMRDTVVDNDTDWKARIINQLDHYRKKAPYFTDVKTLLLDSLQPQFERLVELNVATLQSVCRYLDISFRYELSSALDLVAEGMDSPDDWVLTLCGLYDADEYVNLPGGVSLYDAALFEERGVRLSFRNLPPMEYETPGYQFEPDLSIIDVLMWNSPQAVRDYLEAHKSAVLKVSGGAS